VLLLEARSGSQVPTLRRRVDRVDELIYREIAERRGAEDVEQRDDVLSFDRRPPRGRQPDVTGRDELLCCWSPATDYGDLALLGDRALQPQPGQARAPARQVLAGREEYLTRRSRNPTAAPGDLDRPAQAHRVS
jgi:hypothetical protein